MRNKSLIRIVLVALAFPLLWLALSLVLDNTGNAYAQRATKPFAFAPSSSPRITRVFFSDSTNISQATSWIDSGIVVELISAVSGIAIALISGWFGIHQIRLQSKHNVDAFQKQSETQKNKKQKKISRKLERAY